MFARELAQLAERLVHTQEAAGSSPALATILPEQAQSLLLRPVTIRGFFTPYSPGRYRPGFIIDTLA